MLLPCLGPHGTRYYYYKADGGSYSELPPMAIQTKVEEKGGGSE